MIVVTAVVGSNTIPVSLTISSRFKFRIRPLNVEAVLVPAPCQSLEGLYWYDIGQGLSRYQRSGPLRQELNCRELRLIEYSLLVERQNVS